MRRVNSVVTCRASQAAVAWSKQGALTRAKPVHVHSEGFMTSGRRPVHVFPPQAVDGHVRGLARPLGRRSLLRSRPALPNTPASFCNLGCISAATMNEKNPEVSFGASWLRGPATRHSCPAISRRCRGVGAVRGGDRDWEAVVGAVSGRRYDSRSLAASVGMRRSRKRA
jgi:hypothetical protein